MVESLVVVSVALNTAVIVLIILLRKPKSGAGNEVRQQIANLEKGQERLESRLREEMTRSREELAKAAKLSRDELAISFKTFGDALITNMADKATEQRNALATMQQSVVSTLRESATQQKDRFESFAKETSNTLDSHSKRNLGAVTDMSMQVKGVLDSFLKQLTDLTQMNEQKLERVRETVEAKLSALQEDNSKKLEQMRLTVDEKLHETLEKRLGDSFKLVSDRLEQVHKGLGEMQTLASGVGDLKKVLTNVKTRGTLGEIQLDTLLDQILSSEQYARNVQVKQGSAERVDFAIVLPGQGDQDEPVWLPIDSKFPLEDYQRLMEAQEEGDVAKASEAAKLLESRIKAEAKSIQDKYLDPPRTTDFALLFLPVEGLFAEVLRRSGLWETLQREYRVILAGPTTITALLNSLQMGFRTLAIQKRSSDVWSLLGSVKSEFGKFGDILEKTQKKLQEASNTIDTAKQKSRTIERRLRSVEVLPAPQGNVLMRSVALEQWEEGAEAAAESE